MKKTSIVLLLFIVLLTACAPSKVEDETPTDSGQDTSPTVDKKDDNMSYIYSEINGEYELEALVEKHENSDEIKSTLFNEDANNLNFKETSEKSITYGIETIHINIDSDQAITLENELKKQTEKTLSKATEAQKNLEDNSPSFNWESIELYDYYEREDTVSFIIQKKSVYWASESEHNFEAYVFNKTDGSLLDNSEILEHMKMSEDEIVEMIESKFTEMNSTGNNASDYELNENAENSNTDTDNSILFFRIQPEQTYYIGENNLKVILEVYSPMKGDYSNPDILSLDLVD